MPRMPSAVSRDCSRSSRWQVTAIGLLAVRTYRWPFTSEYHQSGDSRVKSVLKVIERDNTRLINGVSGRALPETGTGEFRNSKPASVRAKYGLGRPYSE